MILNRMRQRKKYHTRENTNEANESCACSAGNTAAAAAQDWNTAIGAVQ